MAEKEKAKKAEKVDPKFAKAVESDYAVVLTPVITEKSMALMQNENKVTVRVKAGANKTEVKEAFQRIFQVKVDDVNISNVGSKAKSRGGRYQGHVPGYKKAVVSVAQGEAIDLFKE